ncbi:hypothetical protein PLESTB_001113800 [Pleodorina starrii]|uniref:RWP-RK domain-containing protein n=1 Tax=Pleodorina starrii TaxID=330485 RepID=A0A9W6BQX0_9CHLO|nr:hypothetical protein PLESTB_001113800 [Pleodorina starrii]
MDFLDDDDDFLKGLPSLADWCPSPNDARQNLPGAATVPNSTLLPGSCQASSDFFEELGPWALSAPTAIEHGLIASRAGQQLPARKLSSASCNTEWMDSMPAMPAGINHSDTGFLSSTWQPQPQQQALPQPQPQPQREQKWESSSASTIGSASLPWPWSRSPVSNGPAASRYLAAFVSAPGHLNCRSAQAVVADSYQQQHQMLMMHNQHQQRQLLPSLCLLGSESSLEEDLLLAEIQAAPWPSSKTSYDATAAAYEAAAALANARLAPPATAVPPPPPLPRTLPPARDRTASCPAACSRFLPPKMYGGPCAAPATASAPPTPVLSPPDHAGSFDCGRLMTVAEEEAEPGMGEPCRVLPPAGFVATCLPEGRPMQDADLAPPAPVPAVTAAVGSLAAHCPLPALAADRPAPVLQPVQRGSPFVRATALPPLAAAGASAAGVPVCTRQPTAADAVAAAAAAPPAVVADVSYDDPMHVQPSDDGDGQNDTMEDAGSDCDCDATAANANAGGGAESRRASAAGRAGGSGRAGGRVTLEALRGMFDLPVQEVVRALGISATDLKRRCRALGIQRWPQRKLMSLRRLAEAVETDKDLTEEQRKDMLDRVARNRAEILADPDAELEACLKPVRQQHYKRNFVDRRSAARS